MCEIRGGRRCREPERTLEEALRIETLTTPHSVSREKEMEIEGETTCFVMRDRVSEKRGRRLESKDPKERFLFERGK